MSENESKCIRDPKNMDKIGVAKSRERRFSILALLEEGVTDSNGWRRRTIKEVAELSHCCEKTVSNYVKLAKDQNISLLPITDGNGRGKMYQDAPLPGKQGGFRWCRLTNKQQEHLVQIAVENPRDTITQMKQKLQEKYDDLRGNLSDSTVWRTLKASNIAYMRAKLKDPLGEGELATNAKNNELKDFLLEQDKGDEGMLNPLNLFFMDETTVYLNETAKRGWGGKEEGVEIYKSKGKTLTLNLYVGLGLVSNSKTKEEWARVKAPNMKISNEDPRGSHMIYNSVSKTWSKSPDAPKFALFWWIRPPTRSSTALNKFLTKDDIIDPNMMLFDPFYLKEQNKNNDICTAGSAEHILKTCGFFNPIEKDFKVGFEDIDIKTSYIKIPDHKLNNGKQVRYTYGNTVIGGLSSGKVYYVKTIDDDNIQLAGSSDDENYVELTSQGTGVFSVFSDKIYDFLKPLPIALQTIDNMKKLLWLNMIEYRQVDKNDGSLIQVTKNNTKTTTHVDTSLADMIKLFTEFQVLVKNALGLEKSVVSQYIPRHYFTPNGRSKVGGKIDSERGDRTLFIKYLVETVNYYEKIFPEDVIKNLRMAWDSAPQHGKIDVDSKHYSYIHNWTSDNLGVPCMFLPVKAPDYNPSENLIGYIKSQIRLKQRSFTGQATVEKMIDLIDQAMMLVNKKMLEGFVRYSCFQNPNDQTPLDKRRCLDPLLQVKDPPNFLDIALEVWKNDVLLSYKFLYNSNIFHNGNYRPDIINAIKYFDENSIKTIEQELVKYKNLYDAYDDIAPLNKKPSENDVYSIDSTITIQTVNCFYAIEEMNDISNITIKEKKDKLKLSVHKKNGYINVFTVDKINEVINEVNTIEKVEDKYRFSSDTLGVYIRFGDYIFKNTANSVSTANIVVPEYKEFIQLVRNCKEDSNFTCIAMILKTLANTQIEYINKDLIQNPKGPAARTNVSRLVEFIIYIQEYLNKTRGPAYHVNKSMPFVMDIIRNIKVDKPEYIEDISYSSMIEVIMKGYETMFQEGNRLKLKFSNNEWRTENNQVLTIIEGDPPDEGEFVNVIEKSDNLSFKWGNIVFENILNFNMNTNDVEIEKVIKNISATSYITSIPMKHDEKIYLLDISLIILKIMKHEEGVLRDINNILAHSLKEEIVYDKPEVMSWGKIMSICNDAILKLRRKCTDCKDGKFKRYPLFDVNKEREKYVQIMQMKMKAFDKKKVGDRRWPGYPMKTNDELVEENYKERGNGPNYMVVGKAGERNLSNVLKDVYVHGDEIKIKVFSPTNDEIKEEVIKEDSEKWGLYFGPFAKENLMKLELARQRAKEIQNRFDKIKGKNIQSMASKLNRSADFVSPNGIVFAFKHEDQNNNRNKKLFYDSENQRLYPNKNESLRDIKYGDGEQEYFLYVFVDNKLNEKSFADSVAVMEYGNKPLKLKINELKGKGKFGFTLKMLKHYPRRHLGIIAHFENLIENGSKYYIVHENEIENQMHELDSISSQDYLSYKKYKKGDDYYLKLNKYFVLSKQKFKEYLEKLTLESNKNNMWLEILKLDADDLDALKYHKISSVFQVASVASAA